MIGVVSHLGELYLPCAGSHLCSDCFTERLRDEGSVAAAEAANLVIRDVIHAVKHKLLETNPIYLSRGREQSLVEVVL